jgi:hypothetical protein
MKAPKGFALTNRIIVRLVRISIETALVTIVAAAVKLYLIFSRVRRISNFMSTVLIYSAERQYASSVLLTPRQIVLERFAWYSEQQKSDLRR